MVLGGLGMARSVLTARVLMQSHSEMLRFYSDIGDKLSPTLLQQALAEQEAMFSRRGAILPLTLVNLVLSALLFAGCRRALRGEEWGADAWSLAAMCSVPYQILDSVITLAINGDVQRALADLPSSKQARSAVPEAAWLVVLVPCALQVLYYAWCALYLRRASVQRYFSDGADTPSSA
jgi:hypothetical protein